MEGLLASTSGSHILLTSLPFSPGPAPTTAWNLLLCRVRLWVISQGLLLGEADDAGDLAARCSAHRAFQLCKAALLPFTYYVNKCQGTRGSPSSHFYPQAFLVVPSMTGLWL